MTTAIDLISRSMRRAGILAAGETLQPHDAMDAISILNGILEQWLIDGLLAYTVTEVVIPATGASSYSIGPTGDVIADRPTKINEAFSRRGSTDRDIQIIADRRFDSIAHKDRKGRPQLLRYRADAPNGVIDVWPVPSAGYSIHLTVDKPLGKVEYPAQEIILPTGYDRALFLTLAVDMCVEFQRSIPVGLVDLMNTAVSDVRRTNLREDVATFDVALLR